MKLKLMVLVVPILSIFLINLSQEFNTPELDDPHSWTTGEYIEYRFFRMITDAVNLWPIRTIAHVSLLSDTALGRRVRDNPELIIDLWTAWNTVPPESVYHGPKGQKSFKQIKEAELRNSLEIDLKLYSELINKGIKLRIKWHSLTSY